MMRTRHTSPPGGLVNSRIGVGELERNGEDLADG